jgi:hypothetical protein
MIAINDRPVLSSEDVTIYIVPCRRYWLDYGTHHSVGYTVLFTTLLVGITIVLYNQFCPSDVLSRGGLLLSSPAEGWQLTDCLVTCHLSTLRDWLGN